MESEIRDGYVFSECGNVRRRMRIFAGDLQKSVPYIIEHRISSISIDLVDPVALHEACRLNDSSILFKGRKLESVDIDLSCMRDCRQIVELSLKGNILHGEVLESFPMLHTLYIDNEYGKEKLHLENLSALRELWITKYRQNIVGLPELNQLQIMYMWNYMPKSRNLSELSGLRSLQYLELIQPRIDSLDGIEQLPMLEQLKVYYARSLSDISAIGKSPSLAKASFDHIPKIQKGDLPEMEGFDVASGHGQFGYTRIALPDGQ